MSEITARRLAEVILKAAAEQPRAFAFELEGALNRLLHEAEPPAAPTPPSTDPVAVIEEHRPLSYPGHIRREWDEAFGKVKALVEFARATLRLFDDVEVGSLVTHEFQLCVANAAHKHLGCRWVGVSNGGLLGRNAWLAPRAEPETKPCPWCGGIVLLNYNGTSTRYWKACTNPGCEWRSQSYKTREEAMAAG